MPDRSEGDELMRAKPAKQHASKRIAGGEPECVRNLKKVEFSQEIVEDAPPKKPLSIYTEETEIKDHQEEIALAKSA
jgi:hypothetical protein